MNETDDRIPTNGNPAGEPGDPLAELLRRTGRRPGVPEDRAARVRAQVHARWREEVDRRVRARRRRTIVALAAAAAAVAAVALAVRFAARPAVAVAVERIEGAPRVTSADGTGRALAVGEVVAAGAAVSTDAGSRVAVRTASGHAVRLDRGSRVRVRDDGSIALESGAVYVDDFAPSGARPAVPVEIATAAGIVRDVGTRFEVRALAGPAVRVRVRDGKVAIDAGGRSLVAEAGEEVALDANGGARRGRVDPRSPEWSWIEAIAAPPDIDGRPLREFLDWFAGERALTLAFADPDTERAAAETRLGGSIRDLTLDEALESVLATAGMAGRIEGGVLGVERADRP